MRKVTVTIVGGPHDGEPHDMPDGAAYLTAHGKQIPIYMGRNERRVALWWEAE